jgi:outer membrane protein TolC
MCGSSCEAWFHKFFCNTINSRIKYSNESEIETVMKTQIFFSLTWILIFMGSNANAQWTLEACKQKARENYPQTVQLGLIEQTKAFNVSNAAKGYLPQISVSAKATYQSEVTEFPIQLPNIQVDPLSKDQYQAAAEVSQVVYDGGIVRTQKQMAQANAEVERQRVEVDLYALNERVNQIFFGSLLLAEQLKQMELFLNDLQINMNRIEAGIQNGVSNTSDRDVLKVEELKMSQRIVEMQTSLKAYLSMLSALIAEEVADVSQLEAPTANYTLTTKIVRPETALFQAQLEIQDILKGSTKAANKPKLSAFVQGGYGKPGLNMLKNEFSPFYIGGLRMAWNLSGFYSQKNNLNKIELGKAQIQRQEETFLFNLKLKTIQQENEIIKLKQLIRMDSEIVELRTNIKKTSETKLENGTLSAADLMRDLNAENTARQDRALHEIQLLSAIANLKHTQNN